MTPHSLTAFVGQLQVRVEQRIEDDLHRVAAVNAREDVDQDTSLLRIGLVELPLEFADHGPASSCNDTRGAEFSFDVFGVEQRQDIGYDRAGAEVFERFENIPGKQLV